MDEFEWAKAWLRTSLWMGFHFFCQPFTERLVAGNAKSSLRIYAILLLIIRPLSCTNRENLVFMHQQRYHVPLMDILWRWNSFNRSEKMLKQIFSMKCALNVYANHIIHIFCRKSFNLFDLMVNPLKWFCFFLAPSHCVHCEVTKIFDKNKTFKSNGKVNSIEHFSA